MRVRMYEILMGMVMMMRDMELQHLDLLPSEYKIPNKKVKHSYIHGKTFYQNPNLRLRHYYNKTIPRGNKFSTVSLRGKEIKANNRRKSIEDKLKIR